MTVRPGAFAVSVFHGVIRDDSYPLYECTHDHSSKPEATECARNCNRSLKVLKHTPIEMVLRELGWRVYQPRP